MTGDTAEEARPARLDDIPRVAELAGQLTRDVGDQRGGDLWRTREARAEPFDAAYATLLEDDDVLVVVGTYGDTILGFGVVAIEALRDGRHLGVITDLYVEPDARTVGLGEAIAAMLIEFAVARDVVGIDAFALPGDRHTKNFFEGHGFAARGLLMHKPT